MMSCVTSLPGGMDVVVDARGDGGGGEEGAEEEVGKERGDGMGERRDKERRWV